MAAIDDSLDRYRNPREALARGATVTEIVPERIVVDSQGRAAQSPRLVNPNVGAGGSAEAQAFRAARAAPAAAEIAPAARAGVLRTAARALSPTTPIGAALLATQVVPAMAEAGRERGAGRPIDAPTAGNVAAGDIAPGRLGAIRANALQQAGGERLRAAYADPAVAGQSVGAYGAGVQQRANDIALVNTPAPPAGALPPTGAGQGRGFVNPAGVTPGAEVLGPGGGRGFVNPAAVKPNPGVIREGNSYEGRDIAGNIDTIRQGGVDRAARGGFVQGGGGPEVTAILQRASQQEAINSGLRRELDAYGPGVGGGGAADLSGGYSERLRQREEQMAVDDLRGQARFAGLGAGRRGTERSNALLSDAGNLERVQAGERAARLGVGAEAQRAQAAQSVAAAADRTARRGQDIGLQTAAQREAGAMAVERERGKTQREVAEIENKRQRTTNPKDDLIVVPGGQEVRDVNGLPQVVTAQPRLYDAKNRRFVDIADGGAAPQALPLPPKDQLKAGQRYQTARGEAVWDGKQFLPVN
jgi:hypothetical protein